jgi:hypothetical protein
MASLEELQAQLKEAETALSADPSDVELKQLVEELRGLAQSASVDAQEGDDGRQAPTFTEIY